MRPRAITRKTGRTHTNDKWGSNKILTKPWNSQSFGKHIAFGGRACRIIFIRSLCCVMLRRRRRRKRCAVQQRAARKYRGPFLLAVDFLRPVLVVQPRLTTWCLLAVWWGSWKGRGEEGTACGLQSVILLDMLHVSNCNQRFQYKFTSGCARACSCVWACVTADLVKLSQPRYIVAWLRVGSSANRAPVPYLHPHFFCVQSRCICTFARLGALTRQRAMIIIIAQNVWLIDSMWNIVGVISGGLWCSSAICVITRSTRKGETEYVFC